jgi:MscS family membrane protein
MEYLYAHSWLISVLFTIFIALLISWMLSIGQRRLLPKLQRTQNTWDDTLLSAAYLPLVCLVWGVAITLMMSDAAHKLGIDLDLINYLTPLRETLFVGALLWFCIRYINRIEISLSRRTTPSGKKRDRTTIHALCQLFRAFSAIVALLWIMQIFKMPINTLLAAGGIGGVALSFAARDTLANFLGGLMIFWDRPFSVGDSVRSPDRNIEGTVCH